MLKNKKFSLGIIGVLVIAVACGLFGFNISANNLALSAEAQAQVLETNSLAVTSLSGTGSETDPYVISTAEELKFLSSQVSGGFNNYSDKFIILTSNIDLQNTAWQPIGSENNLGEVGWSSTKAFSGYFDGNGYTIKNISVISEAYYQGLFGVINGGKVTNLQIDNISIKQGNRNHGAFIGAIAGRAVDAVISNVAINNAAFDFSNDDANATSNDIHTVKIGGIVGISSETYIQYSSVENIAFGTHESVVSKGSILGKGSTFTHVQYCYAISGADLISNGSTANEAEIKYSYYYTGMTYYYYGPYSYKEKGTAYSVEDLKNKLDQDCFVILGDKLVLNGVGNISFTIISSENATVTFTNNQTIFATSYSPSIGIHADPDYKITNIKVVQKSTYSGYYGSSSYEDLKNKYNYGYYNGANGQTDAVITLEQIFGPNAMRQGGFEITVETAPLYVKVNATLKQRLFDITSNSSNKWLDISGMSTAIEVLEGQTISAETFANTNVNYNNKYLSEISSDFGYYTLWKNSSDYENIAAPTFTIDSNHIAKIQDGYILYFNFTNAFPFKVELSSSNIATYYYVNGSGVYAQGDNLTFASLDKSATSPLIIDSTTNSTKLVGWSTNPPSSPLDYYGRDDGQGTIHWQADESTLIKVIYNEITPTNQEITAQGITIADFASWNFAEMPTLKAVWGDNRIAVTVQAVIALADGSYGVANYYQFTVIGASNPEANGNSYKMDRNTEYTITLTKKPLGADILGFDSISWQIAEANNGEITSITEAGTGSLDTTDSSLATPTAKFVAGYKSSSILVVLQGVNNIGATITVTGCEDYTTAGNIKIDGVALSQQVENEVQYTKLAYGMQYTITFENLPEGYTISKVNVNGANVEFEKSSTSFTFVITDKEIQTLAFDVKVDTSFLNGLWMYIAIAVLVTAGIVWVTVLITGCVVRGKENNTENN